MSKFKPFLSADAFKLDSFTLFCFGKMLNKFTIMNFKLILVTHNDFLLFLTDPRE